MIKLTEKVTKVDLKKDEFCISLDDKELLCFGSSAIAKQCLKEDLCIELLGTYKDDGSLIVISAARN
jgi:hypothetical protein